jgi:hypothetical protein
MTTVIFSVIPSSLNLTTYITETENQLLPYLFIDTALFVLRPSSKSEGLTESDHHTKPHLPISHILGRGARVPNHQPQNAKE